MSIFYKILIAALFQWASSNCHLDHFSINGRIKSDNLKFDCLNYNIQREKLAYQELRDITDEIITYCFRPRSYDEKLSINISFNSLAQNISFLELYEANTTTRQLLTWSVPINIIEEYQIYLKDPKPSLDKYFYNCTEPWFGPKCEYSFGFEKKIPFKEIVDTIFLNRQPYIKSSDITLNIPCYVLIECHRFGERWCLDWHEVCNGIIDCFDEGTDEESCFDMEMNVCDDNEFRCHNGLCISEILWENGEGDADCLDRSDESIKGFCRENCFKDPTFRCEEHSYISTYNKYYCGDGDCTVEFETCNNGRHELFLNAITAKGNLTERCWIAMICLTNIAEHANGTSCKTWLENDIIYTFLKECDSFFPFPVMPIYSNHVYFYYENVNLRENMSRPFIPDYICFDSLLCDFSQTPVVHNNFTCFNFEMKNSILPSGIDHWKSIIVDTKQSFVSCVTSRAILDLKPSYSDNPFLYNCKNTSKFISTHRLVDITFDCENDDDETFENSCFLNHTHRIRCTDSSKCWSYVTKSMPCSLDQIINPQEVHFEQFCNGFVQFPISMDMDPMGFNDESNCTSTWCDNIYARCDGYPNCPDARDERYCSRTECPEGTFECISHENYTIICLDIKRFEDSNNDCLGATDERTACSNPIHEGIINFKCTLSYHCIQSNKLCDKVPHCEDGSDETFCDKHSVKCEKRASRNYSKAEEMFCSPHVSKNPSYLYFSMDTSLEWPLVDKSVASQTVERSTDQQHVAKKDEILIYNSSQAWYCNRGLLTHVWNESDIYYKACMCPPSYYGSRCEYQNQRVSITLRLTAVERWNAYAIVSMLIDENDEFREIEAYDQTVYIPARSCSMKLNRYLLFSARPKNLSKKYIVRIDVFENTELTYVGSWYFPIDFLFLPVNRLAVSLEISNNLIQPTLICPIDCQNGSCVKYLNKDKYFCRCYSGWIGVNCNIQIDCQACTSDSVCIGSTKNQPICVCPRNKFGPRCMLESICPMNACQNNGRCIPGDGSASENKFTCICTDQFFGSQCQFLKVKVEVNVDNIDSPSYILAYFFTTSNESKPIDTIVIRKLTIFQQTVTFHLAIPFHLMIAQTNDKYYLTVSQHYPKQFISTSINPERECILSNLLFDENILKLPNYRKISYYYKICEERHDLTCFIDDEFLCLCTNDHHANCLRLTRYNNFQCPSKTTCKNDAKCVQDHPFCPSTTICLCPTCFFGSQCQFYAKGLGSTLDEILGYEFKKDMSMSKQSFRVQLSAVITIIIFIIGMINGILTIMTFLRQETQEVGCGTYLLASSTTSLLTMILFTLKFWFLFFSHQDQISEVQRKLILYINCIFIETLLKLTSYIDSWYNACVAIERTMSVSQGMNFNRRKTKQIAKFTVVILPICIGCLFIPQIINLHVYEDEIEQRSWCVVSYSSSLQMYSYGLIFFHYFAPTIINLLSAIYIIIESTRRRVTSKYDKKFWTNFKIKFKHYKHLIISPIIIVILTSPYLIISIVLDCKKSSNLFWFYLIGYFLSFVPSASIFITFVLPSTLYKQQFKKAIVALSKRFNLFKLNHTKI